MKNILMRLKNDILYWYAKEKSWPLWGQIIVKVIAAYLIVEPTTWLGLVFMLIAIPFMSLFLLFFAIVINILFWIF